jgi:hypothetical protein
MGLAALSETSGIFMKVRARVVGRGHASLLTNSDTWHSKRVMDIGHLRISSPTNGTQWHRDRSPESLGTHHDTPTRSLADPLD